MKYLNKNCIYFFLGCLVILTDAAFAQTETLSNKKGTLYTLVYNEVPDKSKLPLVGVINKTRGDHSGLQLGVININHQNFKGLQFGFASFSKGNVLGSQIGFLNVVRSNYNGLQFGFVNDLRGDLRGMQLGFVNEAGTNAKGLQLGFINDTKKAVRGWQIGFLNVADSITKGVPIGFFSYVKKGGYRAVEVSANELYPVNVGFKTGVPVLYSIILGSYNNSFKHQFALGAGLGSLLKLKGNLYFNPEAIYHSSLVSDGIQATALRLNLRYSLNSHLQVAGGLSFVQFNKEKNKIDEPWFTIANFKLNDSNRLLIGANVSFTYNFTRL